MANDCLLAEIYCRRFLAYFSEYYLVLNSTEFPILIFAMRFKSGHIMHWALSPPAVKFVFWIWGTHYSTSYILAISTIWFPQKIPRNAPLYILPAKNKTSRTFRISGTLSIPFFRGLTRQGSLKRNQWYLIVVIY